MKTKRFVEGHPDWIIEDSDYPPIEGWYYTVGTKWAYIYRGGTKKYRIRRSYNVDIGLWDLTQKYTGRERSTRVMKFIELNGEAV